MIRFGAPSALGVLLTVAIYRADALLLGAIKGPRLVGLYVAAAAIMEVTFVLSDSVSQVLLAHIKPGDDGSRTASAIRAVTASVAAAGLVAVIGGRWLMGILYGHAFGDAWVCLPPLALASVMLSVWKLVISDLAVRDETRIRVVSGATGLALMVCGDIALIPPFGIVGAGIASCLGYMAAATMATRIWLDMTGRRWTDLLGLRRGDVTTVIAAMRPRVRS